MNKGLTDALDEMTRILQEKYGRGDLYVTMLEGDGLAVMFEGEECTGIGWDNFLAASKKTGFDIFDIETSL